MLGREIKRSETFWRKIFKESTQKAAGLNERQKPLESIPNSHTASSVTCGCDLFLSRTRVGVWDRKMASTFVFVTYLLYPNAAGCIRDLRECGLFSIIWWGLCWWSVVLSSARHLPLKAALLPPQNVPVSVSRGPQGRQGNQGKLCFTYRFCCPSCLFVTFITSYVFPMCKQTQASRFHPGPCFYGTHLLAELDAVLLETLNTGLELLFQQLWKMQSGGEGVCWHACCIQIVCPSCSVLWHCSTKRKHSHHTTQNWINVIIIM